MEKTMHIFRYGTNAEQKYIYSASSTFDLLAINGNMLAHAPKAISSFVVKLLLKENMRISGYFIDPITHSFQHDLSKIKSFSEKNKCYEIKSSIKKLIQSYGNPVESCIEENRSVVPSDFDDLSILDEFCKKVIDFECNCIKENIKSSEIDEYLSFENSDYSSAEQYAPKYLIPPYFFINSSEWLDINVKFIQSAIRQFSRNEIYAQIVVPLEFLENDILQDKLVEKYSHLDLAGVMIWIDQLSEHELPYEKLMQYVGFLIKLRKLKIPVFNLYGSFFSVILSSNYFPGGRLLSGVGHGLEYGESRAVIPVGGGIPNNKFYYYKFHNRLAYGVMSEILYYLGFSEKSKEASVEEYYKEICKCKICKSVISDDISNFRKFESTLFYEMELKGTKQRRSYADSTTKELCVLHYQANKNREIHEVDRSSNYLQKIFAEFAKTISEHNELPRHLFEKCDHLSVWLKVLKHYCGD